MTKSTDSWFYPTVLLEGEQELQSQISCKQKQVIARVTLYLAQPIFTMGTVFSGRIAALAFCHHTTFCAEIITFSFLECPGCSCHMAQTASTISLAPSPLIASLYNDLLNQPLIFGALHFLSRLVGVSLSSYILSMDFMVHQMLRDWTFTNTSTLSGASS